MTVSTSVAERGANLREWISEQGGSVHEDLELLSDGANRRGARVAASAASKLLKGTELVDLPLSAVVTPKGVRESLASLGVGTVLDSFSEECVLTVGLLREMCVTENSRMAAYLDTLPSYEECNQPFLWNEPELGALRTSPLAERAREVRASAEEDWNRLDGNVFSVNRDAFPKDLFSLRRYLWVQAVVLSRYLSVGSSLPVVLVPLADQFELPRGETAASATLEYRAGFLFGKPRVAVLAKKDLLPADRLTLQVDADISHEACILEQGMVPTDSADGMSLELTFSVAAIDPFQEDKEDILAMQELGTEQGFTLPSPKTGVKWRPPECMEAYLRLICLGGPDAFLLEAVFRRDVWEHMCLPVSPENERAVCDLIVAACEDGLESYTGFEEEIDTSIENDQRRGIVRHVVTGEMAALEACKTHYLRYVNSLDAIEYYAERRLKALDLLRPVDESEIVDSESGGRVAKAFDDNY